MTSPSKRALLCWLSLLILGAVIQFAALSSNPPGFFIDESSIAYNAYTIATTGRDEHGQPWPLFFRAFGEYKNPVYIYVVAGWFRLFGPSIVGARVIGAVAGLVAAVLVGLLAARATQNKVVGFLLTLLALLTPWLFELSRLAMEVTIYPLMLVLFLWSVWNASTKERWSVFEVLSIATCLALLTYTYSVGRLLAPLLAVGLLFLATRQRLRGVFATWLVYLITLVPLVIFQQRHPGALNGRFRAITYIQPDVSWVQISKTFLLNFLTNLSFTKLFINESSKVSEIVHVPGPPAMLTVTFVLIGISIALLIRRREFDAWWRFIVYGLLVSVIPASLTVDRFHMLRLALVPVFLLVLCIPSLFWLDNKHNRQVLVFAMGAILLQGALIQYRYHRSVHSESRRHTFDADYSRKIFASALDRAGTRPIYLADNPAVPGYIQALWYGVISEVPAERIIHLGFEDSPPTNAVVITTEPGCFNCQVIAQSEPYITYVTIADQPVTAQLPESAMRAELTISDAPPKFIAGKPATINVAVKNTSDVLWVAGSRTLSRYKLCLGNHWLKSNGDVLIDNDGRGCLKYDLRPGETVTLPLIINAPRVPGQYVLEIDMLQEGVAWFRKSTAKRLNALVE